MNILHVLTDKRLLQPWFKDTESWATWFCFLRAFFGLPLSEAELPVFTKHTGRTLTPAEPMREGWVIAGRRGGKSIIAALVALFCAVFRDWRPYLAPGEMATVIVIASDRRQARTILRYLFGFVDAVPALRKKVVRRTLESIEFTDRTMVEVHTASFRSVRGYTIAAAILDELCFWRTETDAASPDAEVVTGLRPGLATLPGSLLLGISSPYSRQGVMWDMYSRYYGKDGPLLVWQSDTRSMNPRVDEAVIAQAYEADPLAAAAEYGGEFRRDIEQFVSREVLDAATIPHRLELPFSPALRYFAFVDPSGGSQDAFTLAIGHKEKERMVLDVVREERPPFSPETVVEQFCATLQSYRVHTVGGDRYAGEWPREQFRKHGVTYETSEKVKSGLYNDALPLLNSGRVELLDLPRLKGQLLALERRTGRGGKGTIDHPPRGHDDIANAVAGVLVRVAEGHMYRIGTVRILGV